LKVRGFNVKDVTVLTETSLTWLTCGLCYRSLQAVAECGHSRAGRNKSRYEIIIFHLLA